LITATEAKEKMKNEMEEGSREYVEIGENRVLFLCV
jgi:hypothetical protein